MPILASMRAGVRKRGGGILVTDPLTGSGVLAGSSVGGGPKTWTSWYSNNGGALTRDALRTTTQPLTSGANAWCGFNFGTDFDMSGTLYWTASGVQVLLLGRSDGTTNNFWSLMVSNIANVYYLRKQVGGTATDIQITQAPVNGDRMRLTARGNVLTAYINGVQLAQTTDTANNTMTNIGIGAYVGSGIACGLSAFSVSS